MGVGRQTYMHIAHTHSHIRANPVIFRTELIKSRLKLVVFDKTPFIFMTNKVIL